MSKAKRKFLFLIDDGWRVERRQLLHHLKDRIDFDVVTHDDLTVRELSKDLHVIRIERVPLKGLRYILLMFFAHELDTRLLLTVRRIRFHLASWYKKLPLLLREIAKALGLRRRSYHQALQRLYRESDHYGDVLANYDALVYSPVNSIDRRVVYEAMNKGLDVICHVYSWDNPMKENEFPDNAYRYLVWNNESKNEVVRLHGVPAKRVELVGPVQFDYLLEGGRRKDEVPQGRYVLFAGSVATYDFHIEQELRIVKMIRRVLDEVDSSVELLVRPYPFTGRENPFDTLKNIAGIRLLSFGHFEEGRTLLSEQDLKDRFDQLQGAVCFINFVSTMVLEASYTDTAIIQINFNPLNEFKRWQDIGEVLKNDHLRHVIDPSFPNVVNDEEALKRALQEILEGRVDAYRAYAEKLQRFANPLAAVSYKEEFCKKLLTM